MKNRFNYLFIYPELYFIIKNFGNLLKKNGINFVIVEFKETLDSALDSKGNEIVFNLSKEIIHSKEIFDFFFDKYRDVYEIEFFILDVEIHDELNKINIQINKNDEIILVSTNDKNISEDIKLFLEPYKEYSLTEKKDYLIYEVGMGLDVAKKHIHKLNITHYGTDV